MEMPKTKIFAIGDMVRVITHRFDTSQCTQYGDVGEVVLILKYSNFDYAVTFPDGTRKYYLERDLTRVIDLKMTPPDMELEEIHQAQELMR